MELAIVPYGTNFQESSMASPGIKPFVVSGIPCVDPEASVREILSSLRRFGIVAVCESGKLIGSLTDHDIARHSGASSGRSDLKAMDLMTPDVSYCFEDTEVDEVERLMLESGVDRIVVLDRRGRAVGSVSLDDVSNSRAG
jgi:CBS domain-containing protein